MWIFCAKDIFCRLKPTLVDLKNNNKDDQMKHRGQFIELAQAADINILVLLWLQSEVLYSVLLVNIYM